MEIRLSEHVKLQVDITHEMIQDYADCGKLAKVKGGTGKDCRGCSLNGNICGIGLCTIPEVAEKAEQRALKKSYLYSRTKDGCLAQERYSEPLPTATGLIQMVYRNQRGEAEKR